MVVVCDMEGDRYLMESRFPLLITVTKDINSPRLPSFSDKLKARKAEIEKCTAEELSAVADASRFGLKGSPTRLNKIIVPSEEGRKGEIFRGNPEETALRLADALKEGGLSENVK